MAEVIVALDAGSEDEALRTVSALAPEASFFKVGLELFTACGPAFVGELRRRDLRVFLDLKLHDIPNTVRGAARSAAGLGIDLLTVHATGGRPMIEAAWEGVEGSDTKILAVTVLTSFAPTDLADVWGRTEADPLTEVLRLARASVAAGVDGVVCSPREARAVRSAIGDQRLIVTPGIRPDGADAGDQARAATPSAAAEAGADFLVVGRPITRAEDPLAAYRALAEQAAVSAQGVA